MGASYLHKCSACSYSLRTSGPWEFYRDKKGERKDYGHPRTTSREAEKRGIFGLSGELYCPTCDGTFDLILVEFKKPARDSLSVWGGRCEPKDEFYDEGAVRCPECGNIDLVLGPAEDMELTCPRCKEGQLIGEMEWVS
ncbi:hypothetical protein ACFLXE_06545 [Chloroflexota bacterium]